MGVVVAEVSRKLFCRGQIGCKIVAFKAEEVTPDQPFGVKVALFRTSAACCLHSIWMLFALGIARTLDLGGGWGVWWGAVGGLVVTTTGPSCSSVQVRQGPDKPLEKLGYPRPREHPRWELAGNSQPSILWKGQSEFVEAEGISFGKGEANSQLVQPKGKG